MMGTRYFAMIAGIIYVIVGLFGFIPGAVTPPAGAPDLAVDILYGYLIGLFPVNILHTLVHLLIGVWGLLAYRSLSGSIGFARGLAIIYGLLTIMGLLPGLNTVFGLIPLFGHDVWLHAVTGLIAAYFGYFAPRPVDTYMTDRSRTT
jgi:hypothetical protein